MEKKEERENKCQTRRRMVALHVLVLVDVATQFI